MEFPSPSQYAPAAAPDAEAAGPSAKKRRRYKNQGRANLSQQHEQRLRLLIESVEDYGIFMLDASGLIGSWNPGASRMKGYRAEEILGRHFACFYTAEQQAEGKPDQSLKTAAREGRFLEEGWRVRKDGSRFWAAIVISAMRDEQGVLVGYAKVTRDLTERLQADRQLAEANLLIQTLLIEARTKADQDLQLANSEREKADLLLQTIVESTPCLIYAKDLQGRMLLANPPALRLIGKDWCDVKGRTDLEFLTNQVQAETVVRNDRRLMNANCVEELEEIVGGAGQEQRVWLSIKSPLRDKHGAVTGLVGVSLEITEKKQNELAAKRNSECIAIASQAAGHGFWDFDIEARTLRWDEQMYHLYGRRFCEGDLPYQIWADSLHPEDRARCEGELRDAIVGLRPFDTEFRVVHPNGAVRHIKSLARVTTDANDRPVTMIGINYDITDNKRATEQLHALNARLEQRVAERTAALAAANGILSKKNEEVEAFVYIVSHDLRAPLVNVQGFSTELKLSCVALREALAGASLPLPIEKQVRAIVEHEIPVALQYISASTAKFQRLIDTLLQLSRTGKQDLMIEVVDVESIVDITLPTLHQAIQQSGCELIVEGLPSVMGDTTAIGQVFSNLISNALKYLQPDRRGRIVIAGETSNGVAHCWIEDNGAGIPASAQPRLFQVFQRFHPQLASGDGMGLAIVKRIIERHGGCVWAVSEEGVGTTFHFTLPAGNRAGKDTDDRPTH